MIHHSFMPIPEFNSRAVGMRSIQNQPSPTRGGDQSRRSIGHPGRGVCQLLQVSSKLLHASKLVILTTSLNKSNSQFPEIKHCRNPVVKALKVCLSDQGRRDLDVIDAALDGAVDFMCYKGGERIASKCTLSRKLFNTEM